jgi:hypothetical protein
MVQRLPGELQQVHFALVARAEVDMAALGAERDPAFARRNEARHAQPRARAQQADDAGPPRLAAADLAHVRLGQPWQRHGQRGEVVDDDQRVQPQPLAHLVDGELPVVVGHAHPVAFHRIGDRDRGMRNQLWAAVRPVQALQVGAHGGVEIGVV